MNRRPGYDRIDWTSVALALMTAAATTLTVWLLARGIGWAAGGGL